MPNEPAEFANVTFTHWWPIVTFCVVNGYPDLLYVSIVVDMKPGEFLDLYKVRRRMRMALAWRKVSMENAAIDIWNAFRAEFGKSPSQVTVSLMTGRHVVTLF